MPGSVPIGKEKSIHARSFASLIQDFFSNPNDLPKSARLFLSLFLERLEKLLSFAEKIEEDPDKNEDLDALLNHMIRLLELPNSADDMVEVSKQIERIIQENDFRAKHKARFDQLTTREKEVLRLLALGCSNKEIARHLCNSLDTIKHHRKIIKSKLSLSSPAEFVQYGQAFNLV